MGRSKPKPQRKDPDDGDMYKHFPKEPCDRCGALTQWAMPRDSKVVRRVASPGMLPGVDLLPHLKCSRPAFGGNRDEADQHGNTGRASSGSVGTLRPR